MPRSRPGLAHGNPIAHDGGVVWLTGLSGAGKSSLAGALQAALQGRGYACRTLDGDALRTRLNADLGFTPADRTENVRRLGEVAALFAEAGLVCIVAAISPSRADRDQARRAVPPGAFLEVFVDADLATCERRDPKGLYKKARAGDIPHFTGISAPYEPPAHPEFIARTATQPLEASLQDLLAVVVARFPLAPAGSAPPTDQEPTWPPQ